MLEAAYNDEEGIAAAFSLNLLRRMNRELDADFDLNKFRHDARYNGASDAIDGHLIRETNQIFSVCGQIFRFTRGKKRQTKSSHKYDAGRFADLAAEAGSIPAAVWVDSEHLFSVHFLEAPGKESIS